MNTNKNSMGGEINRMFEVRNSDNRLVCVVDEGMRTVQIKTKGCLTLIEFRPDGTIKIVNFRKAKTT